MTLLITFPDFGGVSRKEPLVLTGGNTDKHASIQQTEKILTANVGVLASTRGTYDSSPSVAEEGSCIRHQGGWVDCTAHVCLNVLLDLRDSRSLTRTSVQSML